MYSSQKYSIYPERPESIEKCIVFQTRFLTEPPRAGYEGPLVVAKWLARCSAWPAGSNKCQRQIQMHMQISLSH